MFENERNICKETFKDFLKEAAKQQQIVSSSQVKTQVLRQEQQELFLKLEPNFVHKW